jgi:MoxR-like ATPase
MELKKVSIFGKKVLDELERMIIGKRETLEDVFLSFLANGHVLFEDYPGLAKTLIARSFAAALGCNFKRVQFTPDLLPSDITGTYILNRETSKFQLRKGPIFTNILLGDEINRAPPKTQAALLEAMQERQTTIEGDSYQLAAPFLVVATQNPIEYEGTYPLPEAQLDRFLVKLSVGYPSLDGEIEIMARRVERKKDELDLKAIGSPKILAAAQAATEEVHIDNELLDYVAQIVRKTRDHPQVEIGASPRGSLALLKLSRANAAYRKRDYVIPDDVKRFAVQALSHRLILKADSWVKGVQPSSIINDILRAVPVPKVPGDTQYEYEGDY